MRVMLVAAMLTVWNFVAAAQEPLRWYRLDGRVCELLAERSPEALMTKIKHRRIPFTLETESPNVVRVYPLSDSGGAAFEPFALVRGRERCETQARNNR